MSKPSSVEVEEIVHQLVQDVSSRCFEDDSDSNINGELVTVKIEHFSDDSDEPFEIIDADRDYLAKLLFWLEFCHSHSLI